MMRACIVQGSQQVWVAALWYWGYQLSGVSTGYVMPWWIVLIVWPLAVMSCLFAYLMLYGLPGMYFDVDRTHSAAHLSSRLLPASTTQGPSFPEDVIPPQNCALVSLFFVWFYAVTHSPLRALASEILRDFWLSAVSISSCRPIYRRLMCKQPYGRNWSFLWQQNIPKWQILLLVLGFFVGVWAILMYGLTRLSKTHTWLLPIFAVGLGTPRWCQVCGVKPRNSALRLITLLADVVGHVGLGSICTMGWTRRTVRRYCPLAMAGCPRCSPGRWSGYDSSPGASKYGYITRKAD